VTANYILSEEVLRKVLDAMVNNTDNMMCHFDFYFEAIGTLRTILSKPPAKPHSWILKTTEEYAKDNRSFMQPLYTKDL